MASYSERHSQIMPDVLIQLLTLIFTLKMVPVGTINYMVAPRSYQPTVEVTFPGVLHKH